MKKKAPFKGEFSQQERQLIERLRLRPEMMARMQSILEIASEAGGSKTADQVEELLVKKMRSQEPTLRSRKKTLKWWTVFGLVEVREPIWATATRPYLRLLPDRLAVRPRGCSRRLQRVLTDFGCEHSFAQAAQSVQEHYGFEIGATAVWEVTLLHAHRAPPPEKSTRLPGLPGRPRTGPADRFGMIESGHRHILQARLKKAGAAWLAASADQIAHLCVLRANQQWQSFWN